MIMMMAMMMMGVTGTKQLFASHTTEWLAGWLILIAGKRLACIMSGRCSVARRDISARANKEPTIRSDERCEVIFNETKET